MVVGMRKFVTEKVRRKLWSGDECVQYLDLGLGFTGVFVKTRHIVHFR